MTRALSIALLMSLMSCSFMRGLSTDGTETIHKRHYYADLGGMFAAEVVCAVGIIAWQDPDAFAPVAHDPTSWAPGDRDGAISNGEIASELGCTAAAVFMASAIYGHHYAKQNDGDDDPAGGSTAAGLGAVGAAFANGFLGARQQTYTPPVYRAPVYTPPIVTSPIGQPCTSDYGCGIGYTCVKPYYSGNGTCAQAVNSTGTQTFGPSDPDSVGPHVPRVNDCDYDTDCPAGFRCETRTGACVK